MVSIEKFRGKANMPGKLGDPVNRGTVNQGFTLVINTLENMYIRLGFLLLCLFC